MTWKSIRYAIVRAWTCPAPCVKYSWPIVGGRTIPEIIAMFGIVGGLLAAGIGGGSGLSGNLIEYIAFILIAFAMRNNIILSFLFNISFERGLLYHKAVGTAIMGLVLIHAIGNGLSTSGIILGITMLGAPLVYAFEYFLGKFNLFYYPHITLTLVTIPVAFIHGASLLSIALLIWLIDIFFRYLIQGKRVATQASLIGDDVVTLEIDGKDAWKYSAGQYCFLMIPAINVVEYHPFTVASAYSSENKTRFFIKSSGDWTQKLVKVVKDGSTNGSVPLNVFVDGPYGVLSVDITNAATYEHVVLISGGVGVTPMLALFSELLRQRQEKGTATAGKRELHWVWSIRDHALAAHIIREVLSVQLAQLGFVLADVESNEADEKAAVYVRTGKTGNQAVAPAVVEDVLGEEGGIAMTSINNTNANSNAGYAKISPSEQNSSPFVTEKVHIRIHYSAKEKPDVATLNNMKGIIHGKRPDFEKIVEEITTHVHASAGTPAKVHRVGVAVCGPAAMVSTVRDLCDSTVGCCGTGGKQGVIFDCHEEIFRF